MYGWYQKAAICYAHLADVKSASFDGSDFARSGWCTRGWTLQELIAPLEVVFYGVRWQYLEHRSRVAQELQGITGIEARLLLRRYSILSVSAEFHDVPFARRISWAAGRNTTRIEDRAYSLLGLLGVSMPLLYGEGAAASKRLQEEIIKSTSDLALLELVPKWSLLVGALVQAEKAPVAQLLARLPADALHRDRRANLTMFQGPY